MQISLIQINNFRGIKEGKVYLNGHTVLIGDNNAGKSTILEAIDLVLGPDRLYRLPVIDEHDFFNGEYLSSSEEPVKIRVEVIITGLSPLQIRKFKNHLEFWDTTNKELLVEPPLESIEREDVLEALRVAFTGYYDQEEDDFVGETTFCSPVREDNEYSKFSKSDKRDCGFLYLRALRTGSRALSLERGSLLDIILKLREIRPKMWEDVLTKLRNTPVASDPDIGIKEVLEGVQKALSEFVPNDWGSEPHLKVTDLTRESLRKTLTVFMSTGTGGYFAPFHHQGTGTINTMVLALLSMIAEMKDTVIFAMEEPEIAIPPYTQKRIVNIIRKKATQAIFTSHSPFVLEEFAPNQICLVERKEGDQCSISIQLPAIIKPKKYRAEFRLRFAEALLAKRILITEGATEYTAYQAAARRLEELKPEKYSSFEALGIAVFDAETESQVANYGAFFKSLKKQVFAVFDKQTDVSLAVISENIDHPFESIYHGFEDLMIVETGPMALERFGLALVSDGEWPTHLNSIIPKATFSHEQMSASIKAYLTWAKGRSGCAELIGQSKINEIPRSVRNVIFEIRNLINDTSIL